MCKPMASTSLLIFMTIILERLKLLPTSFSISGNFSPELLWVDVYSLDTILLPELVFDSFQKYLLMCFMLYFLTTVDITLNIFTSDLETFCYGLLLCELHGCFTTYLLGSINYSYHDEVSDLMSVLWLGTMILTFHLSYVEIAWYLNLMVLFTAVPVTVLS